MIIYKEICEEVQVNVELEDFDFRHICEYVVEVGTSDPSYYEKEQITNLTKSLFRKDMELSDFVHQMEREEFAELFELMKVSWQNS